MGSVKISTFISGLILGSLAIVLISLFMSGVASNYNIDYDNSTLEAYNQLENLTDITEEVQGEAASLKDHSNPLDILGEFLGDALKTIEVSFKSINIFSTMANSMGNNLPIGAAGRHIKVALISIVLIMLFIGVLVSAVLKKDI